MIMPGVLKAHCGRYLAETFLQRVPGVPSSHGALRADVVPLACTANTVQDFTDLRQIQYRAGAAMATCATSRAVDLLVAQEVNEKRARLDQGVMVFAVHRHRDEGFRHRVISIVRQRRGASSWRARAPRASITPAILQCGKARDHAHRSPAP